MVAALEHGLQIAWAVVRLEGGEDAPAPEEPTGVVPIELHGEYLGVVECGAKRDGPWTDEDRTVATILARRAAFAVRNVRPTEQTARYAADLEVSRSRTKGWTRVPSIVGNLSVVLGPWSGEADHRPSSNLLGRPACDLATYITEHRDHFAPSG